VVGIEHAEEGIAVVLIPADPAIAIAIEQGEAVGGRGGQFLRRYGAGRHHAAEKEQGNARREHHHGGLQNGGGGRGGPSAASVRRVGDRYNGKFPDSRQ